MPPRSSVRSRYNPNLSSNPDALQSQGVIVAESYSMDSSSDLQTPSKLIDTSPLSASALSVTSDVQSSPAVDSSSVTDMMNKQGRYETDNNAVKKRWKVLDMLSFQNRNTAKPEHVPLPNIQNNTNRSRDNRADDVGNRKKGQNELDSIIIPDYCVCGFQISSDMTPQSEITSNKLDSEYHPLAECQRIESSLDGSWEAHCMQTSPEDLAHCVYVRGLLYRVSSIYGLNRGRTAKPKSTTAVNSGLTENTPPSQSLPEAQTSSGTKRAMDNAFPHYVMPLPPSLMSSSSSSSSSASGTHSSIDIGSGGEAPECVVCMDERKSVLLLPCRCDINITNMNTNTHYFCILYSVHT